ncbi:hypothetical protein [Methylobacterium sp. JK268]
MPTEIRPALLVLVSGGLLLGTVLPLRAADDGGFGGLFQSLFAAPRAEPQAEPAPAAAPLPAPVGIRRRAARHAEHRVAREAATVPALRFRVRPRTRYAALPRVEAKEPPAPVAADPQAAALARAGDVGGALLRDATLRPGDIVITATGAKVFGGAVGDRHRPGDFLEASRAAGLDGKTRRLLAAMVAPAGALPADQARRLLAQLHRVPAEVTPVAVQATASLVRVVYPGAVLNAAAARP